MEKKIWGKPEVNLIQFEANEFVSACNARFTADFYCGLPNDPNKMDSYTNASQQYQPPQGGMTHGSCANGDGLQDMDIVNGEWTGNSLDPNNPNRANSIWGVQVGNQINTNNGEGNVPNITHNFANGIGELIDSLSNAGWYLVSWFQGINDGRDRPITDDYWRQHFGIAYIDNITEGSVPNRS